MLPQNLENSLKNTLSKHVGKINIQHVANDTEAQYFAIQLAKFSEAPVGKLDCRQCRCLALLFLESGCQTLTHHQHKLFAML